MKDRFSDHSKQYAAFRPTYPKELYEFILSHVENRSTVWDCGCGNGQVANDLSSYFDNVFATDLSAKQIENAIPGRNIEYSISRAEQTSFPDATFDLITVGQALHWFDFPSFYKEVNRVAKPKALLAVWGYSLLSISPEIDPVINHFYTETIGAYWDKERKLIDDQYKTIPFPFEEIKAPDFQFSFHWTLDHFLGYIFTWSSVQKYIRENSKNPVDNLRSDLKPLWQSEEKKVTFPLFLRLGKIHS
jgi:SAM-dependent methyltransferase